MKKNVLPEMFEIVNEQEFLNNDNKIIHCAGTRKQVSNFLMTVYQNTPDLADTLCIVKGKEYISWNWDNLCNWAGRTEEFNVGN